MKKGGILVNTARKEVINEPELIKLMQEREDLKFVTDIMPDANDEFQKFEGRYFSTPKKMGLLPLSRSMPSSRKATPSSR